MRRRLMHGLALLIVTPFASAQQIDFNYVKRDSREASRRATLAQYEPVVDWGPWYIIGPFDNTGMDDHDTVFGPETNVAAVDLTATYQGKNDQTARWEELNLPENIAVNFKRYGSDELNENAVGYLYREATVDQAVTLPVEMGSDDGLKFWLNGELLVDADAYRGLSVQDHAVDLKLRAGRNIVLVKVTQGTGGWEYQMRPRRDTRMLAWLDYHLNRDFPPSPMHAHYQPMSVLEPENTVLEVGGMDVLPDGRPIVCTRRGEVWIIENAYENPPFDARFQLFATGLHEPLGLRATDDGVLVVQRGEMTRLRDLDDDGRADVFETVTDQWGISGNYHEYAFGPKFDGNGRMWITLNLGFCGSLGKSIVPWRGWAMIVEDDGSLTPVCGGLRSPNGLGRNAAGDMFFTDNQGDWVGTNKLSHLAFGDWHGHPGSNEWYEDAGMPTPTEQDFKPPAIWFPYDRMGRSASDIELCAQDGRFGPFDGQLFVGDQYAASVMRVALENIDGVYQGACFPFVDGLDSGVNRLRFAPDGSLFVGMTNRGWWSFGNRSWGLQRIAYLGDVPFEVHSISINADGFTARFTEQVAHESLGDSDIRMSRHTYERWEKYGSPEIEIAPVQVRQATLSDDGMTLRLRMADPLQAGYVYTFDFGGLANVDNEPLIHRDGYYTVNVVPEADGE